jgi:hypothetical protein
LTARLASRVGRLQAAEDGQRRFFGPPSNLHLRHPGTFSLYQPRIETLYTHGQLALHRAHLQYGSDTQYEEQLTNLFFAWDNPIINAVNYATYTREKARFEAGEEAPLYSPTLTDAM